MSEKILIAGDSTSDLSPELIEKYNITTLPLGVTLGDEHYKDGVDIDPETIYQYYEEKKQLPKTSALNIVDCEAFFKK